MSRRRPEVADVVRTCKTAFLASYPVSAQQRKALQDIESCRSAALGGHVLQCPQCDHQEICYNSCRNRHCPKCQGSRQAQWMEARAAELLPVPYFHAVFTLPHLLGPLALTNQHLVYGILFRAVSVSLQTLASDQRHLGASIGFLALLHTWGQNLMHHPHVHCLIPGGGLGPDPDHWIASRPRFFLPVRPLSRLFRTHFLALLNQARHHGLLIFPGALEPLAVNPAWQALMTRVCTTEWVVYCKPPFAGPERVLKYLARYTHRGAISNRRLLSLQDGRVRFRCKDYRRNGSRTTLSLETREFVRRLLLHVLPKGFVRIRSFGFLANRHRKTNLAVCRRLLQAPKSEPHQTLDSTPSIPDPIQLCPACRQGHLLRIQTLVPSRLTLQPRIRSP